MDSIELIKRWLIMVDDALLSTKDHNTQGKLTTLLVEMVNYQGELYNCKKTIIQIIKK